MFEYLKRKLMRLNRLNLEIDNYPLYYQENDNLIKELANGEKWIVQLDANHQEILIKRIK